MNRKDKIVLWLKVSFVSFVCFTTIIWLIYFVFSLISNVDYHYFLGATIGMLAGIIGTTIFNIVNTKGE